MFFIGSKSGPVPLFAVLCIGGKPTNGNAIGMLSHPSWTQFKRSQIVFSCRHVHFICHAPLFTKCQQLFMNPQEPGRLGAWFQKPDASGNVNSEKQKFSLRLCWDSTLCVFTETAGPITWVCSTNWWCLTRVLFSKMLVLGNCWKNPLAQHYPTELGATLEIFTLTLANKVTTSHM